MDITKILEWLPQLPFLPFATMLISGSLLAMGNSTADWLGIREHCLWLGIVFLVALVFLVAQILQLIWEWFSKRVIEHREPKTHQARLHRLTPGEKQVLRYFVHSNRRTVELFPDEHAVVALVSAGILCDVHLDSSRRQGYRHSLVIVEWAWEYLGWHRDLVASDEQPAPTDNGQSQVTAAPTNS